jgi:hypothetical protein
MWAELNKLRRATKVAAGFRVLGTFTMAVDTFTIGWKIGTGIRSLFVEEDLPAATGPETWYASAYSKGDLIASSSTFGYLYAPADGWYVHTSQIGYIETLEDPTICSPANTPPPPPAGAVKLYFPNQGTYCFDRPVPARMFVFWLSPQEGPVQDWTGQSFQVETPAWSGQPQTATDLQTKVGTELASGEYPFSEAWYAYLLDPFDYEDPTEDEERDDCRPTDSVRGGDPNPERGSGDYLESPTQWRKRYEIVPPTAFASPTSTFPPTGVLTAGGLTYLRYGFAKNSDDPWIGWHGWGWRKIKAKHGWGPTALSNTIKTLHTVPEVKDGKETYRSLAVDRYTGRNGQLCQWIVIVARTQDEELNYPERSDGQPARGIVTAFGKPVTP